MKRERLLHPDPTLPAPPPMDNKLAEFRSQEELYGRVLPRLLVVGDSLGRQWPLKELERFGVEPLARLAVSGDLTQHILWRVQETKVDLGGVELALLIAGSNNLSAGNEAADIYRGILTLVEAIRSKAPSARIAVIQVPARVHRFRYSPETHAELNRLIAAGGEENGYTAVCVPQMDPTDEALYKDGLHMHRPAYRRIMAAAAQALDLRLAEAKKALDPDPGS